MYAGTGSGIRACCDATVAHIDSVNGVGVLRDIYCYARNWKKSFVFNGMFFRIRVEQLQEEVSNKSI